MCVCMNVCVCVCVHACVYVRAYVCVVELFINNLAIRSSYAYTILCSYNY